MRKERWKRVLEEDVVRCERRGEQLRGEGGGVEGRKERKINEWREDFSSCNPSVVMRELTVPPLFHFHIFILIVFNFSMQELTSTFYPLSGQTRGERVK